MSEVVCQMMVRCMSSRTVNALMASMGQEGMDVASCQEEFSGPGSSLDRIKSALEAGTVTFSTDNWGACKSSLSDSCNSSSSACELVLVGTVAEEGGCFIDEECADGDNGQEGDCSAEPGQCGTCSLGPARAAAGEDCAHSDCASGLFCNDQQLCEARPSSNGGSAGEACEASTFDAIGDCDRSANLLCINAACQAAEFSSEAGADCGNNGVLCEGGLVCPVDTSGGSTQCAQAKAIGEACIEMNGQDGALMTACGSDAFCDIQEQICAARKANGEACEDDGHCSGDSCIDGTCTTAPNDPSWQACN
jgi:hypothetical protein